MPQVIRKIQNADPVFLFMVVAVILALGCSLTLRAMVNLGPQSARAGEPPAVHETASPAAR